MISSDQPTVPSAIQTYQAAHDGRDFPTALAQFADDAMIVFDGCIYDGISGVESFLRTAASEYTYTRTLISSTENAPDRWLVTNHLEGDFPGGSGVRRYPKEERLDPTRNEPR